MLCKIVTVLEKPALAGFSESCFSLPNMVYFLPEVSFLIIH